MLFKYFIMEEIKKHLEYEHNRADNAWWQSLTDLESKRKELEKQSMEAGTSFEGAPQPTGEDLRDFSAEKSRARRNRSWRDRH